MVPTYAVVNTASTPLDYSVTIAGERGTRRLGPQARQVIRVPVDIQKGSLVIEHQGLPGDLVGAGLLQGRIGGKLALAPLPVVDPARLDSTRHHVLRAPSTGQRRTWLTLYNPTAVSQRATLSAFDATRGRRLARKRQSIAAGRVQTVRLDALLAEAEGTLPKEVRLRIDHPGDPASLLVSGTRLSRAGQVWSLPCFQDSQAHHNGTYPLLNLSRGAVATTWLNLGSKPAKVVAQLDWAEGGAYALPEITIASGASYRLDFAELIRKAQPDLLEREIDPSYQSGFFRWSARGGSRRLLARTEVNPVEGGRFGFNCAGCCLELPYGAIEPASVAFPVGSTASFAACEYRNTCSGGPLGPFNASSPSLTVPSPFTWNGFTLRASGSGSGTLSFTASATRYEVINGVCTTFTDTVASSGSSQAVTATIGNVARGSGLPDSLPPSKSRSVSVTITPTLTSGNNVRFDVTNGDVHNGTAEITSNKTRTSSGTITVKGGKQTRYYSDTKLRIRARLNGEVQLALSAGFRVCAHPKNFRKTSGYHDGGGVLKFEYKWDSDSGSESHLDDSRVGERVTYPGSTTPYVPPNPPFILPDGLRNPTLGDVSGSEGGFDDTQHYIPAEAGTAGSFTGTQYFRYKCNRCSSGFQNLLGPISIQRIVELVNGVWRYRAVKSGVTGTRNL